MSTVSDTSLVQPRDLLIATALVESDTIAAPIQARLDATRKVLSAMADLVDCRRTLVVFQAGWFDFRDRPATEMLKRHEPELRRIVGEAGSGRLALAFGIDGNNGRDQLAGVLSPDGFKALARKFHPTAHEMGLKEPINLAEKWSVGESGYSRIADVFGRKIFIAVCYDTFGIQQLQLPPPDVDAVVCHLHLFGPHKSGYVSGDSYFARLGLAGASRQWNVPVFAAAQFLQRTIPAHWPSGVSCEPSTVSTRRLTYEDIALIPTRESIKVGIQEGMAELRFFKLP